MKKLYLCIAAIAGSTLGMSQTDTKAIQPVRDAVSIPVVSEKERPNQVIENQSRFTVLWEDDMSVASNWLTTNTSVPVHGWEFTTNVNGAPFAALNPISTPTAANGFFMVNSDAFGTAQNPSLTNANLTYDGGIDLTGHDFVNLRFYCVTRNWSSTYTVRVSGDGGSNWVDFPVLPHITTNVNTLNPELVVVNISNVAGGQSDVRIQFNYEAEWGWFWAVDDVSVVVPDDYDGTISNAKYNNHDSDVDFWNNLEYTIYDVNQISPLNLNANAFNAGAEPLTGVFLEVNITGPSGFDQTINSASVSMLPGEEMNLTTAPFTPPAVPGTYNLTYTLKSNEEDANLNDNTATRSFMISDGEYARDSGVISGFAAVQSLQDYKGGPGFYMINSATLYCIGAAVAGNSTEGASFEYELREAVGEVPVVAASSIGTITADMLNTASTSNFTYLNIDGGSFPLDQDLEYIVTMHSFESEGIAAPSISTGTAPDFTSYVWGPLSSVGTPCNPCYTGSIFMVRMGLSQEFCNMAVNVEELASLNVRNMYPNPTVGMTTVEYTLLETSKVQMYLFDVMGRIVMSKDMGAQQVGEHRFEFDFSHVASGSYTFALEVNGKYTSQSLIKK